MVDFLVLCNQNVVHYKDYWPYIKDDKIRFSSRYSNPGFFITQHKTRKPSQIKMIEGVEYVGVMGVRWLTSLKTETPGPLELVDYKEDKYKWYDNYPAINVDSIREVPDYDDVMGVPENFIDVWCREQFDIVGMLKEQPPVIDGKLKWTRILIKKKLQK